MVYYHAAFPTPETRKMRKWGLITLVIFGSAYLLIRTGYNFIKNLNKFFAKGLRTLSNQILFLFICLSLLIVTYTYGAFDNILINWEYLIGTIAIVILSWIVFCTVLLVLSLFVLAKWEQLERDCKSFQHFKDTIRNGAAISKVKDAFEFLALKRFFFVPLFPVLKAMSLRQELRFSTYLELCLLRKLRLFFKLSWTTWIALIFVMMFWNVFIIPSSVLASTLFIMIIPLLGLLLTIGLYSYSLHLYRKVIVDIDSSNLSHYNDIDYNSNDIIQEMCYPDYLFNYMHNEKVASNAKKRHFTIHEHMHQRPPSLYETIFIFGQSGPYFMLNILQCCCFLLVCWGVVTFGFFAKRIIAKYSKWAYVFLIVGLILYVALQSYFTILALKLITVISSIEMKRSDKCVKKMINRHNKKISEISYSILNAFKKIYFDYKNQSMHGNTPTPGDNESNHLLIEENEFDIDSGNDEFKLNNHNLQNFITLSFNRFNKMDAHGINIKYELKPFMRTCGNVLNNDEVQFLLYLLSKKKNYSGIVTLQQLCDVCGILLHFREKKPYEIVNFVFQKYYSDNNRVYRVFKDETMKWTDIEVFLCNYQEYFDSIQRTFIEEECKYMGERFSLDSFISMILTPSQYHPY